MQQIMFLVLKRVETEESIQINTDSNSRFIRLREVPLKWKKFNIVVLNAFAN